MAIHISKASASAMLDTLTALLNGGKFRVYSGTRPADVDSPIVSLNKLLATFDLPNPAFDAAVDGLAVAKTIAATVGLVAGEATWFRAVSAAEEAVIDGDIGTEDADAIIAPTASIAVDAAVTILNWQIQQST